MGTKEERDVESLIRGLADENSDTQQREKIIEDLGKIGGPAVEPLIRALQDKNSRVRIGAAWALGKTKDRRAVGPLIRHLEDKSNVVRAESAFALGEIGDKKAIKPLETILLSWSSIPPGLIKEARIALEKLN